MGEGGDNGGGSGIREMAEREAAEAAEQEQLFESGKLEGDGLSFLDLMKQGAKHVEVTVSFRAAEFDSPEGGLLHPTKQGMALVTYQWEEPDIVPKWEGGKPRSQNPEIEGWKVRQILKPIFLEKIEGEPGIIEANFAELLAADPAQAGALLERLQERARSVLAAA